MKDYGVQSVVLVEVERCDGEREARYEITYTTRTDRTARTIDVPATDDWVAWAKREIEATERQ